MKKNQFLKLIGNYLVKKGFTYSKFDIYYLFNRQKYKKTEHIVLQEQDKRGVRYHLQMAISFDVVEKIYNELVKNDRNNYWTIHSYFGNYMNSSNGLDIKQEDIFLVLDDFDKNEDIIQILNKFFSEYNSYFENFSTLKQIDIALNTYPEKPSVLIFKFLRRAKKGLIISYLVHKDKELLFKLKEGYVNKLKRNQKLLLINDLNNFYNELISVYPINMLPELT